MSIWNGNADDFYALANDLSQVGAKAVPAMRGVMDDAGRALATEWAENARAINGPKGTAKAYPASIDHELRLTMSSISVEAGPNARKKQGFLGRVLEFGGTHNAPQMSGLRAVEAVAPRAERMIDSAMGYLFP